MFYEMTQHVKKRLQQRGKSAEGIKMLMRYGTSIEDNRRVLRSKESRRQIARRRAWLERLKKRRPDSSRLQKNMSRRISVLETMCNCVAVYENGKVITVYNQTRRRWRRRFRRR